MPTRQIIENGTLGRTKNTYKGFAKDVKNQQKSETAWSLEKKL